MTSSGETAAVIDAGPKVWLITSADTAVGFVLLRKLLDRGDCVVAGVSPTNYEYVGRDGSILGQILADLAERCNANDWRARLKILPLDSISLAECQASIAAAEHTFGRLDTLLCCASQTLVGTAEEVAQCSNLTKEQFEINFHGPTNIIKASLPGMRERGCGHILVLSGITGHLGTPGLSVYCASQWALEAWCDSLAYEIAPSNIKVTIVQASIEIGVLTNTIKIVPSLSEYETGVEEDDHPAPLFRSILERLSNRMSVTRSQESDGHAHPQFRPVSSSNSEHSNVPTMLEYSHAEGLVTQTVHAIMAIGGAENPPSRRIVGYEGVASVKEKLKIVSEELEEFADASASADYQVVQ